LKFDAVDVDMPLPALLVHIAAQHHSRYRSTATESTTDRVLNVKDGLRPGSAPALARDRRNSGFRYESAAAHADLLAGNVNVDKVLEEMRRKKMHIAIVIDEYGGRRAWRQWKTSSKNWLARVNDEFDVEAAGMSRKPIRT